MYTEEDCIKWATNPAKNPKTGRAISNTPIKILKNNSKWNMGSEDYYCFRCNPDENDDSFYKTIDIICAIARINMLKMIDVNYNTPGIQIFNSNSFYPKTNAKYFGVIKTRNGYHTYFNFSYFTVEELKECYNLIGINVIDIKSIPKPDNMEILSKMTSPNPDNLVYKTKLAFKDTCKEIVYFKNASCLDCLSNNIYYIAHELYPIFNKDSEITSSIWKSFLQTLELCYGSNDKIDPKYAEFTPSNLKLLRSEYMKIYSNNYKVHIQPKSEYYFWTIFKLLSNPAIKEYVAIIKINLIYDRSLDTINTENNIPIIIMYVYRGQEILSNLLQTLNLMFPSRICEEIGLDICPRFNRKINKLLYIAEGDGDFKTALLNYGTLDQYYDKSENYGVSLKF